MKWIFHFGLLISLIFWNSCDKPVAKSGDWEAVKKISKEDRVQIFIDSGFSEEMQITLNGNPALTLSPFGSDSFYTTVGKTVLEASVNGKVVDTVSHEIVKDEKNKDVTARFLFIPGAKHDYEVVQARYAFLVGGGLSVIGKIENKNWISDYFNYYPPEKLPGATQGETTLTKIYRTITESTPPEVACHFLQNPDSTLYLETAILLAPAAAAKLEDKSKAAEILFSCFTKQIKDSRFYLENARVLLPILKDDKLEQVETLLFDSKNRKELRNAMMFLLAGKGRYDAIPKAFEARLINSNDLIATFKDVQDELRKKLVQELAGIIKYPADRDLARLMKLEDFEDDLFFENITQVTSKDPKSKLAENIAGMFKSAYNKKELSEPMIVKMQKFMISQHNSNDELLVMKMYLQENKFDNIKDSLPNLESTTVNRLFDLSSESKYRQTDLTKMLSLWTLDSNNESIQKDAVSAFRSGKNWLNEEFEKKIESVIKSKELNKQEEELSVYYFHIQLDKLKPYSKNRDKILAWMPYMLDSSLDKAISEMTDINENEQNNIKDLIAVYPKLRDSKSKERILRNFYRFRKSKEIYFPFLEEQLKNAGPQLSRIAYTALIGFLYNEEKVYISKYSRPLLDRLNSEEDPKEKEEMKSVYVKWWMRSLSRHYKKDNDAGENAIETMFEYKDDKELSRLAAEAVIDCCSQSRISQLLSKVLECNAAAQKVFSDSHFQVFRENKNPALKLAYFQTFLNSQEPEIRKDNFRNLNFAIKRMEVDVPQGDTTLLKTMSSEKDDNTRIYMQTTYYRDKLQVLKNEIYKDPSKAETAYEYIDKFPENDDLVSEAVSCLLRAKNKNLTGYLVKNYEKLSDKSVDSVCSQLFPKLRNGEEEFLPIFTKALTSKNNNTRYNAFDKLANFVHDKNPLKDKLKELLQKAYDAELDDVTKRRMTYKMSRLK